MQDFLSLTLDKSNRHVEYHVPVSLKQEDFPEFIEKCQVTDSSREQSQEPIGGKHLKNEFMLFKMIVELSVLVLEKHLCKD